MPTGLAIDLHHVAKIYRKRIHALRGITMQVRHGEIFGLLGPNGAGKSTLVKIMMAVVRPTRADGLILGKPIGHKGTLARIGYLPENHRFPRYLTGRQTLEFFAALSKVDRQTARRRTDELLNTMRMSEWADQRINTYSKGMLQRIGLAQALVHDPDLVLLDEPTDGVDPVGRREILDVLGTMRAQGKTIFINSHALAELESICDRVAILLHGQVAKQGRIHELSAARERYEIEIVAGEASSDTAKLATVLAALGRDDRMQIAGPVISFLTDDAGQVQPLLDRLRGQQFVIRRVQPMRPTLEELFLETVIDPATGSHRAAGAIIGPPTGGRPQ